MFQCWNYSKCYLLFTDLHKYGANGEKTMFHLSILSPCSQTQWVKMVSRRRFCVQLLPGPWAVEGPSASKGPVCGGPLQTTTRPHQPETQFCLLRLGRLCAAARRLGFLWVQIHTWWGQNVLPVGITGVCLAFRVSFTESWCEVKDGKPKTSASTFLTIRPLHGVNLWG